MKKRMIIMLIGVFVVFGGIFGMKWFGKTMMVKAIESMPVPPATISTAKAEQMSWDNGIEAIGNLVPVQGADLTAQVAGVVSEIHFESGADVNKGDLLATLDNAVERGELQRLQAEARVAELNRDRLKKLLTRNAVSKSDYDSAEATAAAAQAAVVAQRGRVEQKEVRAPFSGRLGVRLVSVGQYVAAGAPVVTLQSLDPIDLDFRLPEQLLEYVRPGLEVGVTVDGLKSKTFAGKVLAVEPKVDAATHNFTVRARLANPDQQLYPGQFARIKLALPGSRDLIVIPRTAVSYSSYGTSVFVVKPPVAAEKGDKPGAQTVEQRFVTLGDSRGDFIAVSSGLEAGEEVASSGLLKLHNQQPVIINNDVMPQPELNPTPPQS